MAGRLFHRKAREIISTAKFMADGRGCLTSLTATLSQGTCVRGYDTQYDGLRLDVIGCNCYVNNVSLS